MFFNELDMLETRFHILEDVVDHFVVCEAPETHSGQPKPFYLWENWSRFARWHKKIIYVRTGNLTAHSDNSWLRERYHRSQIAQGLTGARDEDWVIVADVDEIPAPQSVLELDIHLDETDFAVKFELAFYYYNLNHRVNQGWAICARRNRIGLDPNDIRTGADIEDPTCFVTYRSGWHFSYFGGAQQVVNKVDAFMHHADPGIADLPRDPVLIADKMAAGVDLYGRDMQIERVPLSDTLPRYILDNLDHYRQLGWVAE
jgi:beta-1,4-mannosyl-glycoprotein beta-1,4-N-acetylglucosaminyltransferase